MRLQNKFYLLLILTIFVFLFSSCKKKPKEVKEIKEVEIIQMSSEINILIEKKSDNENLKEIIKAYKDVSPDTKINIVETDDFYSDYSQNENIDLLFYKPILNKNVIPQNLLYDFNNFEDGDIFLHNSIKNAVTEQSSVNVFPISADVQGIIINKKLFRDNNLETPKTFENLQNICSNIKSINKYPFQFYLKPSINFLNVLMSLMGMSNGGLDSFFNDIEQTGSSEKIEQISNYTNSVNLVFDSIDYSMINYDYEQALNEFASDRAFMILGNHADLLTLLYIKPELELELIPFTNYNNAIPIEIHRGFSILESSLNKEEAKDFIKFFNTSNVGDYYINKTGKISLLPNSRTELEEIKNINDFIFQATPFVNDGVYFKAEFLINLKQTILNYVNYRNTDNFANELENTIKTYPRF